MDISPLPHKQPFSFVEAITLQSPTPEQSPDEEMISPCEPVTNSSFQVQQPRPLEYGAAVILLLFFLLTEVQTKAIGLSSTFVRP